MFSPATTVAGTSTPRTSSCWRRVVWVSPTASRRGRVWSRVWTTTSARTATRCAGGRADRWRRSPLGWPPALLLGLLGHRSGCGHAVETDVARGDHPSHDLYGEPPGTYRGV